LSYSGGSGKSFGSKGSSSQKKERKKKQEYHKHRLKFTPEEHVSFEELKDRVAIGLDRLGIQVFSSEPGGYGFHNWMTSFNLLLDDFEEKCGPTNLPKEYFDGRLKMSAELQKPIDTAEFDIEIQRIEKEIQLNEENISEVAQRSQKEALDERHEDDSKIQLLKKNRIQSDKEIEKAQSDLDEQRKKVNQSLFKRLFSSSEAVKLAQEKLDSLQRHKEETDESIRLLEEDRSKRESARKNFDLELSELRSTLEDLKRNLGEVEFKKLDAMQISERRKEVANSLSAIISSLHLSDPPNNGSS
jgi:DNA repair exonuclease SbcCD ATPase subunit